MAKMFSQQMFFWGCDAQSGGNLLTQLGATRIARERACGEGSSRYRWRWMQGTVELHSFCAGWYPDDAGATGIVFIRARERFFDCAGATPLTPGHYEEGRFRSAAADEMPGLCRPLFSWLADYEERLEAMTRPGYRARCYEVYRTRGQGRPWLPPAEARAWLSRFLTSPEQTVRATKLLRRLHASRSAARVSRVRQAQGRQ